LNYQHETYLQFNFLKNKLKCEMTNRKGGNPKRFTWHN